MNEVALITGGTRGIGKEIAYTLAEENYDIIINYRTEKLLKYLFFTVKKDDIENIALCDSSDNLSKIIEKIKDKKLL